MGVISRVDESEECPCTMSSYCQVYPSQAMSQCFGKYMYTNDCWKPIGKKGLQDKNSLYDRMPLHNVQSLSSLPFTSTIQNSLFKRKVMFSVSQSSTIKPNAFKSSWNTQGVLFTSTSPPPQKKTTTTKNNGEKKILRTDKLIQARSGVSR